MRCEGNPHFRSGSGDMSIFITYAPRGLLHESGGGPLSPPVLNNWFWGSRYGGERGRGQKTRLPHLDVLDLVAGVVQLLHQPGLVLSAQVALNGRELQCRVQTNLFTCPTSFCPRISDFTKHEFSLKVLKIWRFGGGDICVMSKAISISVHTCPGVGDWVFLTVRMMVLHTTSHGYHH